MMKNKTITVRELQHNLASYIELAKVKPITISKYGKNEVVIYNPDKFEIAKKKSSNKSKPDIMESEFIGMYKNDKDFKGKNAVDLANDLREKSWYGK